MAHHMWKKDQSLRIQRFLNRVDFSEVSDRIKIEGALSTDGCLLLCIKTATESCGGFYIKD